MKQFNSVIQEHIPRLRRYAIALLGDRARADDLVQDTLERAWTRFHLWQQGSNLRAWLFTIMHNLFANQFQSDRLRGIVVEMDDSHEPSIDSSEHAMQVRDLHKAMEQLPTEYKEVLLLVGLEQLSYDEVSKILNIPMGTVMSRLSRGREKLQVLMSDQAPVLRRVK